MNEDAQLRIEHELVTAYRNYLVRRRHRRRTARLGAMLVGVFVLTTAAALAAAHVLGGPAPEQIKADLSRVDRGLPSDLKANPDVQNARAVAVSGQVVVYSADMREGGFCYELAIGDGPGRGAICVTKTQQRSQPIELSIPTVDSRDAPVAFGGRVNASDVASLEIRYGSDGPTDQIPLGTSGFFAYQVPSGHAALATHSALTVRAMSSDGLERARETIPADWNADPVPDSTVPLYVSTRSDESDLTKVYGLEGHVAAAGVVALILGYPDGSSVRIRVDDNGDYDYTVPAERTGSFMTPRPLTAVNPNGEVVVKTYVAAVAYWRGRERQP